MTKEELIAQLADDANVTKAAAGRVLESLIDTVLDRAANGYETTIHKFGTFGRVDRKARKGRNPATNEAIDLPAVSVLRFRPSKTTRDHLN